MNVHEMETEIKKIRKEFRELLENGERSNLKMFLRKALDLFAGEFEEETLKENLKEEQEEYMKDLKAQGA